MAILYIVPDSPHFIRKALKIGGPIFWTYFGYKRLRYLSVVEIIGRRGVEMSLARYLKRALESLRQPYLDHIGELSRKHAGLPFWWGRSIPEKNPYSSKLLLYSAYIQSAIEIYSETVGKNSDAFIVFAAESSAVRLALERNLKQRGIEVRRLEPAGSGFLIPLKDTLEILVQRAYFVLYYAARSLWTRYVARLNRLPVGGKPIALFHAWGDLRAFRNNFADFIDSDFEEVKKRFKGAGEEPVTLVRILPSAPFFKAVWKISRHTQGVYVLESFIYFKDLLCLAMKTLRPIDLKPYPTLMGLDISSLLDSEIKRDQVKRGLASVLLYDSLVKNLKSQGAKIDRVIYTFENLNWERVLCSAMRRYFPDGVMLGYQPARIPQYFTPYFISCQEYSLSPLPDFIVSNGRYAYEIMKEVYGGSRVKLGGSLRQQYLLGLMGRRPDQASFPQRFGGRVLVASSIGFDETVELIGKAWTAFAQTSSISVVFKCHPSMPFATMEKALRMGPLPAHFSVTEEPMSSLLKKIHVLVYNTSTVAAEAMALGIPCVHVEPDADLDLDPLDFCPQSRLSTCKPDDLRKAVLEILADYPEVIRKNYPQWQEEIGRFFGPVTEQTFELFTAGRALK